MVYQNQPEVLDKNEYKTIHQDIAKKILSIEEKNFTTIPMAENLIDNMRSEKGITKKKLEYVNDIDSYISNIRRTYEKALWNVGILKKYRQLTTLVITNK